jgi:hypothetical protein
VAHALRCLIELVRRRVLAGVRASVIAAEVRADNA